jgi:hypothetical protein
LPMRILPDSPATPKIADLDVVTAGSQIGACLAAYGNVVGASIV